MQNYHPSVRSKKIIIFESIYHTDTRIHILWHSNHNENQYKLLNSIYFEMLGIIKMQPKKNAKHPQSSYHNTLRYCVYAYILEFLMSKCHENKPV